ncbi:MAG: tetratricopeptide repeat protein [Anaerolineales bacterium]|nr:tetratricopeptide repeat protein [Anaerolineales bacterium]
MRTKYFILLLIFLSACMPQADNVIIENTIAPSPTPEIVDTITPLPTATLSEVDKIFVIPTKDSSFAFDSTPMPISTPITTSTILLRNLSENDYINWIRDLQTYSYQNYPPYGDWWSDGEFISSQLPVALVIQEFLYRYPNSIHAERLKWQLAFFDSLVFRYVTVVGGNVYDDNWVVSELEAEINQGKFLPNKMEEFLDQYWFDVDYYQPVENLFGDDKISWFYVIKPQIWQEEENNNKNSDYFSYGGLFIVIRKLDNGEYKIYSLENAISFVNGASSLFEISDFNQNGITEIALGIGYHSGNMCLGNLHIYEWKEEKFKDLTKNEIVINNCIDRQEYSIVDGIPSIIENKMFQPIPSIYKWNGSNYEFSGYIYSNSIEKWWSADTFSEEAQAIEEILASENFGGLEPAQIDFLRYRLGIVYALSLNEQKAIQTFHQLIENPLDITRTVYSDFARNFLRHYSQDKDLYFACQKSREVLANTWNVNVDEEKVFGFFNDIPFGLGLLRCFTTDVFKSLVQNVSIEMGDLPDELSRNGIDLFYAGKKDVDLDGVVEEWIIIHSGGIFLVFPDEAKQVYRILELQEFWDWEDSSKYTNVKVEFLQPNDIEDPVLQISTSEEVILISISRENKSTLLVREIKFKEILFSLDNFPSSYQVIYKKPTPDISYPDYPWRGYRWDALHQEFKPDLFEYVIFVEKNKEESVEISENLLPMLDDWRNVVDQWSELPRYYYLCALAYELAGDSQKAAEIYYQLWREFPESHYARLAKFKLEPINP